MNLKIFVYYFVLIYFIGAPLSSYAQTYTRQLSISVADSSGYIMKFPWAGGLNAPIFNSLDLNGDGIDDLFLFEKDNAGYEGTFRYSTFINNGTTNLADYSYAPQFESLFPTDLHDWVLAVDYDCDGRKDLFAYSNYNLSSGIALYHNDSNASGISFHKVTDLLYSYDGTTNNIIYSSYVSQPAFVDVDGDGDIDLLTFTITGGALTYHKNMAMELYSRCDTLVFYEQPGCWGKFSLNAFSNSARLHDSIYCPNCCPRFAINHDSIYNALHSGSCLLAFDNEGDSDVDIINGDLLGYNLLYLRNGGTKDSADITLQDTLFPSYNTSANFFNFPGAYYFDADNDGNKDLIVTSCLEGYGAESYYNILLYHNTTNNQTNIFNYIQNRFLVNDMIEVGSGANVSFLDVDGDGLTDMLIGNYGYFDAATTNIYSGLAYYRNTGTANCASFQLMTSDYAGLFSLGLIGLHPAFGDLDGDGDMDMIIGEENGTMLYFTNIALSGNPAQFALTNPNLGGFDVGNACAPFLVDVNRDGKLDIIAGNALGSIYYFENTGTITTPSFTLVSSNFGGVDVVKHQYGIITGYSSPLMYDSAGNYHLLVGSESGYIYHYTNIDGNLGGNFTLVDSVTYGIHETQRATIAMSNLDNDSLPELLVGNFAGGVSLYSQNLCSSGITSSREKNVVHLYPNPVSDLLVIKFDKVVPKTQKYIYIYDMPGNLMISKFGDSAIEQIDISKFNCGMYFCKIINNSKTYIQKFVVEK